MILPSMLLAASLWNQTGTISFTCRAEPLSHLVIELSKATGLNLGVSRECANDVILISVKDVSTNKLLAEIAKVDAGAWIQEGPTLRFTASSVARHAEARAEVSRNVKTIRAELVKARADLQKFTTEERKSIEGVAADPKAPKLSPAEMRSISDWMAGVPQSEAVLALLGDIDPDLLVLHRSQRVVFSTHPNSTQYSLGSGAQTALETMIERQNASAEALAAGLIQMEKAATPEELEELKKGETQPETKKISGYSKGDMVITDGDAPGHFQIQLTLYAQTGAQVYQLTSPMELPWSPPQGDDLAISSQSGAVAIAPTAAAPPSKVEPTSGVTRIEISEAAKAFRNMYKGQRTGNSTAVPVPPSVLPYFLDVEHNDLLALSASDELLAFAQAHGQPLVAVVPDSAFIDATQATDDYPTLEGFTESLKSGDTMTLGQTDGWAEIQPTFPASERESRCGRSSTGPFFRSCIKDSIPTLDAFADFTLKNPEPSFNAVVAGYLTTAVSGFGNAGLGTIANWNLYRIYAEFGPDQRSSLLNGAKLPLRILSVSQHENLLKLSYDAGMHLQFGPGSAVLSTDFPSASPQAGPPQEQVGFEDEPTELLPSGPQPNGYIELKSAVEPFVSPSGEATNSPIIPRVLGVAQIARKEVNSSQPGFGKNGAIRFDRFRLGSRTVYALTIHPSEKSYVTGRLYDFRLDLKSPVLTAEDLPADWRAEMARRIAQLKQQRARNTDGPVAAPPPLLP